ncbi:MAG: hypothetical protein QXV23_06870 [Candidatus Bathyarchaeia archaeon]
MIQPISSLRKSREEIENAARGLGETMSKFVREAVLERVERVRGRLEHFQLTREDKIREIFKMLNMGIPCFKIAEVIGDLGLIEECYRKWVGWIREARAEDMEKRQLRYEKELCELMVCQMVLENQSLHEYADFVCLILTMCEKSGALPSEILRCSVDEFIKSLIGLITKEKEKADPLNIISQLLLFREAMRLLRETKKY